MCVYMNYLQMEEASSVIQLGKYLCMTFISTKCNIELISLLQLQICLS